MTKTRRRALYTTVNEWALRARILLASLALTEPRIASNQDAEIGHLLRSARWIETFTRRHPWIIPKRKRTAPKRPRAATPEAK